MFYAAMGIKNYLFFFEIIDSLKYICLAVIAAMNYELILSCLIIDIHVYAYVFPRLQMKCFFFKKYIYMHFYGYIFSLL